MEGSDPPSAPATPQPPQTLGQTLRSARLAQDLTLEQLSTELRIEAKQLQALEEERFEQIGVAVFIKGYLKQYGTRLGLDVRDLLALYYKQTTLADVQIQPNRTIKLRDERQITSWILALIVLLTVIVGLAVWWWNGGSFGSIPLTRATPEPAPAAASTAPEGVTRAAAAVTGRGRRAGVTAARCPGCRGAGSRGATRRRGERAAGRGGCGRDYPRRRGGRPGRPGRHDSARVLVRERELGRGHGRPRRAADFGLNAAGRRLTVRGEPPFAVVLGDADAVRLTVDGEPYSIPTTGREGSLARFSVDIAEE